MRHLIVIIIFLNLFVGCILDDNIFPEKWPNGIIKYRFTNSISEENREKIVSIMNEIETFCPNIHFIQWPKGDYVVKIYTGKYNRGTIGYSKKTFISFFDFSEHVIRHELCHTIGLNHEHQRPDRKKYIIIDKNNFSKEYYDDLKKLSKKYFIYNYKKFEYDYKSITHYSNIKTIEGNTIYSNNYFSDIDKQKINEMYK